MSVKRFFTLLVVLAAAVLCTPVYYAENEPVLIQGCPWEENIDIYVSGEINTDSLTCKISNQAAEIVDGGLLADKDVSVRTTILLDISTSMPAQMRSSVQNYIDDYIKNLNGMEQLRLATFCDQLNVLQDFTSDRYDLADAADKIAFNGNASMIYDAVYNTLPEIQTIDGKPCFYRTIIITDGVDRADSGVTKEELYLRLQSQTYPVEIIAVSVENQQNPEKELAALARISGGRYINLNSASDPAQLQTDLGLDRVYWIRAVVPAQLLDGSTRQFDISDGVHSLQFDFKVPVFEMPAEVSSETASQVSSQSSNVSKKPVSTSASQAQTPPPAGETASLQTETNMEKSLSPIVIIGTVAGIMAVILVFVIVLILRALKKGKGEKAGPANKLPAASGNRTVIIPEAEGSENAFSIRLRNVKNPDQIWSFEDTAGILVGRRTECQVYINDISVSREQCKIYIDKDNHPTIENVSQSNITQLNGELVSAPSRISEGDTIKFGYITLMVDTLSCSGGTKGNKPIGNATKYINV